MDKVMQVVHQFERKHENGYTSLEVDELLNQLDEICPGINEEYRSIVSADTQLKIGDDWLLYKTDVHSKLSSAIDALMK